MNPDDLLDTTIADIHRIRREMAARFHGDLLALTADAQARAEASGRTILRRGEASRQAMPETGGSRTPRVDDPPAARA